MNRTSRRLAVLGSALVGLLGPLLLQPAQAAAPSYVALGDSYASGTGTRSYIADGTSCQRSTQAYPSLIAAARGYALNFRACSGARITDVTATQLSALTTATGYVSISVGGNDAGFADVLTECALPGWASNCNGKIDGAQAFVNTSLPGQLATLYSSIRARAPYARVVVVGYPRIFMGEDCNAFTWFSPAEQSRLNQMADLINARTAAAASAAGFSFANPTTAFVGHAVCDNPEWINGLSSPISESYHPKATGHAGGYTPTVSPLLTGAAVAVTAQVVADSSASGAEQAALQSQYVDADRSIEPEVVVAPDLTTPEARRAARKAGIDLDRFLAQSQR
ncbi:GDSL-like Lipase/Acylhydrolase family protein [Nocardioides alpinus]|uniref:GDSL-like Lipase/Acylhydrolase family protein n=1 Tax=Nocardioides alpinus TaxID=748909 RepID=A0A1I0Z8L9_9ACTN|nr:SGNH/GDSL hydrolase family protein [Nocardioides alpinus]PKH38341.1 SGNH/GDSL hydrolase family protein [Nocardioides alpinus]SFB20778.1 GDSL-like Lipase/Acylhydrolase family protein [Nocardioides alpinus]